MIIASHDADGAQRITADLSPGETAYVDSDWLIAGSKEIPAIVADGETVRWGDEAQVPLAPGQPAEEVIGAELYRIAREAAEALGDIPGDRVAVQGDGIVATLV